MGGADIGQLEARLRAGLAELGLGLDDDRVAQLLSYLGLLHKWNSVYNLTAVRELEQMLTQHLLDSLAVIAPLQRYLGKQPARILDVGSGGGLPGVVVAICCPDFTVDCVDTVAKKAAFIQQAAGTLRLRNLRGLHERVERVAGPYQVICSRAFSTLADFTRWSQQALAEDGAWMAMKGRHPTSEIEALPPSIAVFHVEQLAVPGLDAERRLVWMRKAAGPASAVT